MLQFLRRADGFYIAASRISSLGVHQSVDVEGQWEVWAHLYETETEVIDDVEITAQRSVVLEHASSQEEAQARLDILMGYYPATPHRISVNIHADSDQTEFFEIKESVDN